MTVKHRPVTLLSVVEGKDDIFLLVAYEKLPIGIGILYYHFDCFNCRVPELFTIKINGLIE
jgi:hypothetical protein